MKVAGSDFAASINGIRLVAASFAVEHFIGIQSARWTGTDQACKLFHAIRVQGGMARCGNRVIRSMSKVIYDPLELCVRFDSRRRTACSRSLRNGLCIRSSYNDSACVFVALRIFYSV